MRTARSQREGRPDVDEKPLHLTVDLDRGSEPIAGSLEEADGSAHRFKGYMDLISMLEALRASPQVPRASQTETEGVVSD